MRPNVSSHDVRADIPIKELLTNPRQFAEGLQREEGTDVYVVCRLGNDSQLAVDALREVSKTVVLKDLVGGLRAWSKEVDSNFPIY